MGASATEADEVLRYWFDDDYASWPLEKFSEGWYKKWFGDTGSDAEIKEKFESIVQGLREGSLDSWRMHPWDCLAGIIAMDQFTRNMFRGTAEMYSMDEKARSWAGYLESCPEYKDLHPAMKLFVCLPFMHSEDLADQEKCIEWLEAAEADAKGALGQDHPEVKMVAASVDYGRQHRDVVQKFGRFPHRNSILSRENTPEEEAGLADGSIASF